MPVKNFMGFIPMTSLDSATFSSAYLAINPAGLDEPCFAFKIINNSNVNVLISLDGTTDHDIITANSAQIYDVQTNSQPMNECNLLRKGQIIYVNGAAGVGLVYLVGLMQPNANFRGL